MHTLRTSESSSTPQSAGTSVRARVLFVDDEERIVSLLRTIFRNTYDVFTATNGHDALDIMRKTHIHVLVSDQRMPAMLGVELLGRARQISPNTMRILLTGYSDLAAIVGSVNDGEVFRYINKPWDHREIKEVIAQAAEIARETEHTPVLISRDAAAGAAPQMITPAEILVIDDNEEVINSISGMFHNVYGVHGARNVAQAIEILRKHDISVIITDTHVNNEDTTQLLRILKTEYPLIMAILLTQAMDSDIVIRLINQVQIFRYANKPIRRGALQLSVKAAVTQSGIYRSNPALLSRHTVASAPETAQTASLRGSILSGLRALRSRFNFLRS